MMAFMALSLDLPLGDQGQLLRNFLHERRD